MTPQDEKEQIIQRLMDSILKDLEIDVIAKKSTRNHYNWNIEEHVYMPEVAKRLREKGYSVSSSVNHSVTDWIIAV